MVSGNLRFSLKTPMELPINSFFFTFFLRKIFVQVKTVDVVYFILNPNVVLFLFQEELDALVYARIELKV